MTYHVKWPWVGPDAWRCYFKFNVYFLCSVNRSFAEIVNFITTAEANETTNNVGLAIMVDDLVIRKTFI